jgi:hypothetical protein
MLDSAPIMIFLREDRLPPKQREIIPEAHRYPPRYPTIPQASPHKPHTRP